MTPVSVGSERRVEAPHPGPLIRRDYIDVLGLTVEDIAAHLGVDAEPLRGMLAGTRTIDVATAVRLSRALQLPAERIMRMQLRHDFAEARDRENLNAVGVLVARDVQSFPDIYVRGRLARANDPSGEGSLFFQQQLSGPVAGDAYAGLHALWRGDRLRVYDTTGAPIWTGPVLTDLDGRVLLPYVRTDVWLDWFGQGRTADLWIGPDHEAFFERMEATKPSA